MRERGVLVSFNSDSDELARRLNFEAAKAVKYGSVPPADALAFVTSNPAKQLGIADRVGSLEAGKDGDFVVWSGDPLSTSSMALETWIEGRSTSTARPTSRRGRRSSPSARRSSRRRRRRSSDDKEQARRQGQEDAGQAAAEKPGMTR